MTVNSMPKDEFTKLTNAMSSAVIFEDRESQITFEVMNDSYFRQYYKLQKFKCCGYYY